jgi:isomerase DpgB
MREDMQLQHSIDGSQPLAPATVAALDAFIDRVEDAPAGSVALLDLTGTPASTTERPPLAVVNRWERVLRRLERVGTTTVAVVHGDCGGTAVEALLATDLRVATTDARLHLPVAAGGVWPGMGLYRLANQVGYARLRRVVLFADAIPADRALALDLVDEVTDDLATASADTVAALAATAGPDVAVRRQLMLDATTLPFEEALGRHLAACDRVLRQARTEEEHGVAALV